MMTREIILRDHNRPVSDELHPLVFKAIASLVLWYALSAWILFDRQSDVGLLLAVVSGLLLVAMLVPWLMWCAWKRSPASKDEGQGKSTFRDWAFADFESWQSKQRGGHAAIEALLPIAAVAFGLTALGLIFVFSAAAAP
jgi:hypothetical protein